MKDCAETIQSLRRKCPKKPPESVCDWAKEDIRIPGSLLSPSFDVSITPWLIAPIECGGPNETERCVFVKPIQCGGTTAGEVVLLYWLRWWQNGDVFYYWPNDAKATDRWKKYTRKRIAACKSVTARLVGDRGEWNTGLITFPHANFAQLGANTDRNVSSDSVRGVVCEELHVSQDGWAPGRLDQVFGRQTNAWNKKAYVISNASQKGDQLHQAFLDGTQQFWEVPCPGCKQYHRMRARWDDRRPELGGLRYNADGCRRPDGTYDYNKLKGTIFYQMPCGYRVNNNVTERRQLSLGGRYSEPTNTGAMLKRRSFTLEGVAIDNVDWIEFIEQKHKARRALERGDPELWDVYQRERECLFTDPNDRPIVREITLSTKKKDRGGMPNRECRFGLLDRQKGVRDRGELPHWWLLIEDWDLEGNSQVVYEGKILTDQDVLNTLSRHEVRPIDVTVDSSWDTSYVYDFCLRNGFCCIKVVGATDSGAPKTFGHPDGSERIYSPPEFLWQVLAKGPTRDDPAEEPRFWHVSKWGAMEREAWVRSDSSKMQWEVPSDVSDDFKAHMESWVMTMSENARTGEKKPSWKQLRDRDDLYQLRCYSCMCAEMCELIGMGPNEPRA